MSSNRGRWFVWHSRPRLGQHHRLASGVDAAAFPVSFLQTSEQIGAGDREIRYAPRRPRPLPQVRFARALATAFAMRLPAYVALLGEPPRQSLPKAGFVAVRVGSRPVAFPLAESHVCQWAGGG